VKRHGPEDPPDVPSVDTLFSLPRARSTDPWTSHAAAMEAHQLSHIQQRIVLHLLKTHGPMTCDEIAAHAGIDRVRISRRVPELVERGLARDSGSSRKAPSGRYAIVWEAL